MAKFGKSKKVALNSGVSYDHHLPALAEQGYDFRFEHTQANGTKRQVFAGPDGKMYALFSLESEGHTYTEAGFREFNI